MTDTGVQAGLSAWLLACVQADLDEADRWEHDSPDEGGYYSCPATRSEPYGDLPYGEENCDCGLAKRRARVLVECDTKRKRIELHSGGHECSVFDQNDEVDSCRYVHAGDYCSTLLLEAQPFAGRPGFQDEWRSVQITW